MILLNETIAKIGELDKAAIAQAQKRLDNLTKPQGSLGRLEELAKQIAGISGNDKPTLNNKVIFTMAGDHGVADSGVSAYPKEVTPQMVYNFLRGGAGINVLARQAGARVIVVDMGVADKIIIGDNESVDGRYYECKIGLGTANFARGAAMLREEAIAAIDIGIKLVNTEYKKGMDIVGTGDMGIGNTTASSAITAVFTGARVSEVTGYGTGISDSRLRTKVEIIEQALSVNRPNPADPIDVLSKVGGYEIGGIVGVILGAAAQRVPVVIDGFISGAAALIAIGLAPKLKDFIIASHCSAEPGHQRALAKMGLKPLLDLNLRLGEGTGAALAMMLCESAVRVMTEMATFSQAGVSEKADE